MKIKEAFVTLEKPTEIFSIIESTLSTNINTQVFVDTRIYDELMKNGWHSNVYSPNCEKTFHYWHDSDNCGGENWLSLTTGGSEGSLIAIGSFISNCKEYMQLVEFSSSKVNSYTHFLVRFKQLLLIKLRP